MKKKLAFLIPITLLLGFLAVKPPAIGSEKGDVIVTPEATVTPSTKPQLRDFDEDGVEPEHFDDHRKHDGFEHRDDHGRDHHDEDLDEDSRHEDD
ncbi:MAG: hypothetical protein ACKOEB_03840 [Actinomycetota bacterium]